MLISNQELEAFRIICQAKGAQRLNSKELYDQATKLVTLIDTLDSAKRASSRSNQASLTQRMPGRN